MKNKIIPSISVILFLLMSNPLFISCNEHGKDTDASSEMPATPDYASRAMWFDVNQAGAAGDKAVDVFYVTPTCIWDWKDSTGTTSHYMNVYDPQQRAAVDGSNYLAFKLFEPCCNFYSPYYRQISMDSWFLDRKEIDHRYGLAHEDIVSAYRYYMEHLNNGRPFILAGHSQGAKAVVELLKHTVTDEEYSRMIAAYAFGFEISSEELMEYPHLKPAAGADDTGCIICYNTVSHPEAVSSLFSRNEVCINPINWTTDETYAPSEEHLGSVFFDADRKSDTLFHKIGVRVLNDIHTLRIDGMDDDQFFIPEIAGLFPKGNYHVQELNLYFLNLQKNLFLRISSHENMKKSMSPDKTC